MSAIEQRVRRGARYLDRRMPGWASAVDAGKLILSSCSDCVLGQVFGNYERGVTIMGFTRFVPTRYGFSLGSADDDENWNTLDRAWRREVEARRARALAS